MRAATTGNGLGPSIAPTVDADNPWPGPEAFREADQQFFFGRDIACRSLTRLVLQSRLTILYGRSGLGKTSLLRAGLFPRLRDTSSLPVYVRLSWDEGLSLTARGLRVQVKRAIEQATADHHIDGPVLADDQTLWEWFFRSEEWFFTERSHRVRPVLVFDQFEEIFTHGRSSPSVSAAASQFLEELVDLVRGSMPTTVAERLASDATGVRTFDPGGDPCGVLIALRQEFLADLLRLRPRLPSLLDHRFELSA